MFNTVCKRYCLLFINLLLFSFIISIFIYWTSDLDNNRKQINKITGLILARCGSKGIKLKNIAKLNGKSLLQNSLEVLLELKKFDKIFVSTDCDDVANNVKEFTSSVQIHWRESYTATDDASSLTAVREFLQKHPEVEAIGLVQCTSVFIEKIWLEKAYNMIKFQNYDSVFSVSRSHKLEWEALDDGTIIPINFDPKNRPRRQDWKGFLVETGMFYFMTAEIIKNNLLQGGRIGIVEVPMNYSMEVDTEFDLKLVRSMISLSFNNT